MRKAAPDSSLVVKSMIKFSGERYIPGATPPHLEPRLYLEHVHRYAVAAQWARGRVLDLGSGVGYGADILASRGVDVVAIDSKFDALAYARLGRKRVPFRSVGGDGRSLPFASGVFDFIACFEVIEHIEEVDEALAEIRRVLRDDGVLAISTPNRPEHDSAFPGRENPFHVYEYERSELRQLLRGYFPEVELLGQRLVAASRIVPDGSTEEGLATVLSAQPDSKCSFEPTVEPMYFVALCSNREICREMIGPSLFLGHLEPLLQALIEAMQEAYEVEVARRGERIRHLEEQCRSSLAIVVEGAEPSQHSEIESRDPPARTLRSRWAEFVRRFT